jgi:AcrR family transcriptional regulator
MAEPVKRRYRSPARAAQAARTRASIIDAADALFREHGFGRATVKQIAEAAGVVPETVYATFGNKGAVLTAILDLRLAPDGEDRVVDRPDWLALADSVDQRELLRSFADVYAAMAERVRPVAEVLRTAKAVDPEMAIVRDDLERHRHASMRTVAEWLVERGPVKVSVDRAADIIWTIASPDVSRMLCDVQGWSREEYARWLEESLAAALLDPSS